MRNPFKKNKPNHAKRNAFFGVSIVLGALMVRKILRQR
jgi:hypothetical protein